MPTLSINAVVSQEFWRLPAGLAARIAGALPAGWSVEVCEEPSALAGLVRRSRVVMGWPFPSALARGAAELRWVHFFTAAVPESWRSLGDLRVTSSSGANAGSVAEHGLFLALAALRGVKRDTFLRWDPEACALPRSPRALSAGVIGYGPVGQHLVELLRPLFASVRVLTRRPRADAPVPTLPFAELPAFLAASDFVFLAVPSVAAVREVLAPPSFFVALRPDVCVINLARGELVSERAMLEFLEAHPNSRYLADVARPEPYPDAPPLWSSPRVLLTSHVAARRDDAWQRIEEHALEALGDLQPGG